jgi:single-strand selective monofunctional uracil DNA glycosylase
MSISKPRSIFERLSRRMTSLDFSDPVAYVYNPLEYAGANFFGYLERFAAGAGSEGQEGQRSLFLGMNPGPWGMAQTGVPFGTVSNVRDWLGFSGDAIHRPARLHPKRPILGFECPREEVSGQRFWGWAEDRFGTPERFFQSFFVLNYCPLLFLDAGGRNLTPDKIRIAERQPLLAACDDALVEFLAWQQPCRILGIGVFAEQCARRVAGRLDFTPEIGRVLHPSPASPLANQGWEQAATQQLRDLGLEIPGP